MSVANDVWNYVNPLRRVCGVSSGFAEAVRVCACVCMMDDVIGSSPEPNEAEQALMRRMFMKALFSPCHFL